MTTIHISPQLADKLNRLAEREHKTVDEVLERLLEGEEMTPNLPDNPRPGSGAALLKSALEADISWKEDEIPGGKALLKAVRKANIHSGKTDTAKRSREILENEFPKYLRSRIDHGDSKA